MKPEESIGSWAQKNWPAIPWISMGLAVLGIVITGAGKFLKEQYNNRQHNTPETTGERKTRLEAAAANLAEALQKNLGDNSTNNNTKPEHAQSCNTTTTLTNAEAAIQDNTKTEHAQSCNPKTTLTEAAMQGNTKPEHAQSCNRTTLTNAEAEAAMQGNTKSKDEERFKQKVKNLRERIFHANSQCK